MSNKVNSCSIPEDGGNDVGDGSGNGGNGGNDGGDGGNDSGGGGGDGDDELTWVKGELTKPRFLIFGSLHHCVARFPAKANSHSWSCLS